MNWLGFHQITTILTNKNKGYNSQSRCHRCDFESSSLSNLSAVTKKVTSFLIDKRKAIQLGDIDTPSYVLWQHSTLWPWESALTLLLDIPGAYSTNETIETWSHHPHNQLMKHFFSINKRDFDLKTTFIYKTW